MLRFDERIQAQKSLSELFIMRIRKKVLTRRVSDFFAFRTKAIAFLEKH